MIFAAMYVVDADRISKASKVEGEIRERVFDASMERFAKIGKRFAIGQHHLVKIRKKTLQTPRAIPRYTTNHEIRLLGCGSGAKCS